MADPKAPNDQWRELSAAIAKQLSGLELQPNYRKILSEAVVPVFDSSSALQKTLAAIQMPPNFLGGVAGQTAVISAAFRNAFQAPEHQDQLKRIASWQIEGLQKAFQTPEYQALLKQFADLPKVISATAVSKIGPAIATWQSKAFQQSWKDFSKIVTEAFKQTANGLQRVELLAALGWTLPMGMSIPEFNALVLQDNLTVETADQWFLNYYCRDEGQELNRLHDRLLASEHLAFWKPLLEQVFGAFERGDLAICVPSLMSVLEGSIAVPWGVRDFHKECCRKKFFEQRIKDARDGSIHQFLWKSVAAFVKTVFKGGLDPNQKHPLLKRNLILHGKSDPAEWDRADCLRLFQATDTVVSCRRIGAKGQRQRMPSQTITQTPASAPQHTSRPKK